ncbi:oligosaccharide flippase family protein [Microbacterium sp. Bi128]|uniref:oligosaccharide flippase family protein n=1 Tax=Microbacterium sp. Bi128 TaxID=2821115 RepID=UPI001DD53BA4|nr:oligosaccharide flippase family protein [Microbacterium sp. Bi128]CAH0152456.1 Teichuronic acid biosynthesis protein TuaB [Microbacterium sp. Bi128]
MTTSTVVAPRRRGAALLLGAQWVRYLSQLAGLVLLARLVGPADAGIVALAGALAGLAAVLGDFGLSMAALRAPTLTAAQRTSLFWANTVIGLVATGLVVAVAPAFAAFYDDPRLIPVLAVLAPAFVLRSASAQFRVELNRSGRLGRLAAAELAGDLVGLTAAIVFALLGGGALALASQGGVAALVTLGATVILTPWHPGLPRRGSDMRGLLTFGGHTFLVHALNYVSTNIGTLAVGRVANDRTVGLFSRATQLVNLPIDQLVTPLTRVVVPTLADASDPTPLEDRLAKYQTALSYPVLAYVSLFAVTAEPAIRVVLGAPWAGAATYVPIFAIGAVFQTLGYPQYWAFVATGRSGLLLWCEATGRILMTGLVVALSALGPAGVAVAMSIGQFALWAAAFLVLPRTGVSSVLLLRASLRPVAVFTVGAIVASVVDVSFFTPLDPGLRLLAAGGAWAIVVGTLLPLVARRDLRSLWGALRRR